MSDKRTNLVEALKAWLPGNKKESHILDELRAMVRELWLEADNEKAAAKKAEKADK